MDTTTNERPATSRLGRCRSCKRTFDPYLYTDEGYLIHEDGTIRTPGTPAGRVKQAGDQTTECTSCGRKSRRGLPWWEYTTMKATRTASACDIFCTTATGDECHCSCGGWAHGSRA